MSTAVRESSHVSRKIVSHGGPISGQSHSAATASSLENNLDALLEDLQTSVARNESHHRIGGGRSPQLDHRMRDSHSSRLVSTEQARAISPTRTTTTTTEKYVSSGPAGAPSGIPGLELLDTELRDVQPGQSKTVAYKQVSYQYNKSLDGKPVDTWPVAENVLNKSGNAAMMDDFRESYEERRTQTRHRSPETAVRTTSSNRELLYTDSSSRALAQPSPQTGGGQHRDLKFVHESSYHGGGGGQTMAQTIAHDQSNVVEYVPVPSPTIPINLAPGPNTKVTTTIKTYTYELPGAPETYLASGNLPKPVVLPGDQTITYTLPRSEKVVGYQSYQETDETDRAGGRDTLRYASPSPGDAKTTFKETKYYREEQGYSPGEFGGGGDGDGDGGNRPRDYGSPGLERRVRNEYYESDSYERDYPAKQVYRNESNLNESYAIVNRTEERYPSRPPSSGGRHSSDSHKTPTPTRAQPHSQSQSQHNTTVYKYSNVTSSCPTGKHPEDHEVLLKPQPFPTTGVQVHPSKPANGQGPPKKLEDLMASFSDSEREVLEDIEKQEIERKKRSGEESARPKKEVEFVGHTPAKVQSKNVAGPPVYYPPGSAEFTRKEEASGAMSQSSGGWQKASGKYEYEASSKEKSKQSSGKAVVPVCLPLCCALPCVIM